MGYPFDSTSNFNATWSNSYASAVLAPGSAVAAGFARAADKRYFEFVVDANADVGYLWLGVLWRIGTSQNGWLIGGGSEVGTTASGVIGGKSSGLTSVTAEAGDVFGFAVNYSTDGIGGLSSVTYAGAGIIEISKNGVFTGHRAVFPASGPYVAGARPLIIQESGTSTSAVVTLRVDSLSYSYMPAGYSEWGASGGLTPGVTVATITWGWVDIIPANSPGSGQASKGAQWSISGTSSAKYAAYPPASISASALVVQFVRTKQLPIDKKVVFEVIAETTKTYSSNFLISFVKEDSARTLTVSGLVGSLTQTGLYACTAMGGTQGVYIEGSLSTTGAFAPLLYGGTTSGHDKLVGYAYNPDRGFNMYGIGGISDVAFNNINSGLQHLSLTSSVTLFCAMSLQPGNVTTNTQHAGKKFYLNDGLLRRLSMPLFPGWSSLSKRHYVSGGDTYWDLTGLSTTAADVVSNEIACYIIAGGNNSTVAKANKGHSSGKRYYEIQFMSNNPSVTGSFGAGVANASCSYSHSSAALLTDFYGTEINNGPVRATMRDNITLSSVEAITLTAEGVYARLCVAVDFDAGNIWIGRMQATAAPVQRVVNWFSGGDPAGGASPLITFTASTTLYPAFFAEAGGAAMGVHAWAAFEDGGFAHDPPTGFSPWASTVNPSTPTTTATVTPSFTGSISGTNSPGGSGTRKWPFGFRP